MEENVIIAIDAEKSKKIKGIPSSWNWEDIHFYLIILNWDSVLMLCSIIQKI